MKVFVFLVTLGVTFAFKDSGCGNEQYLAGDAGTFTTMNFDGVTPYDRNASCRWNIDIADTAKYVQLNFNYFDIEGASSCNYDNVTVYDGLDENAPILALRCGHHLPHDIVATSPNMFVTFESDFIIQWTGFEAAYSSRAAQPISCQEGTYLCGDTATGTCNQMSQRCDSVDDCVIDEQGCPGNKALCGEPAIPPNTEITVKVVNGTEAVPHSWPWQITLHNSKSHSCGGSVLNEKWVITAAHCIISASRIENPYIYDIRAGKHNLTYQEPSEQNFAVEQIFVHENYTHYLQGYDIALLKIRDGLIVMTDEVSEICLPNQGEQFADGQEAFITGWGDTMGTGDSDVLQQARTQVISTDKCNHPDAYNGFVKDESMICAGYLEGGIDTCQGDSGGPMVVKDIATGKYILIGLTSWGDGCAEPMKPGVYAKVSTYVDWVNQVIHDNP